ncbi:unnamed protein product [Brassica napus]|uniref:(rape) hypothetical protein n=1 Tax=Brassica napus TaxID=3708 RepID=A0A816SSP1_BRANA|nr:unnamed protein product [Brassica napus]
MAKDQVIAINDAVHKLQLAMLDDGITDQKQLFAAGTLISRSRNEPSLSSAATLSAEHPSVPTSLEGEVLLGCVILWLFGDALDVKEEGLGLSNLTIRENDVVRGGEVDLEQWMGPSCAVKSYVPCDCESRNDSKATDECSVLKQTSTKELSTFGMMWDSLFSWASSSSLAYIYGKDKSAHEEFLFVYGKEYPRRIILVDGLSSEIKETIAGCLARALPRVATDLRLPIPISELGKGLVEQWQVIVFVLLDALSVCRIPRIAPYIFNRNKVLEGSGIGNEDYETMKDILLPLGRVPQFATRCGG